MSAAAGDPAAAEERLTHALERFEQLGAVFEAALTKERLAAVAPNGRASRLGREALATYDRLGAAPHAERLRGASRPFARPR